MRVCTLRAVVFGAAVVLVSGHAVPSAAQSIGGENGNSARCVPDQASRAKIDRDALGTFNSSSSSAHVICPIDQRNYLNRIELMVYVNNPSSAFSCSVIILDVNGNVSFTLTPGQDFVGVNPPYPPGMTGLSAFFYSQHFALFPNAYWDCSIPGTGAFGAKSYIIGQKNWSI